MNDIKFHLPVEEQIQIFKRGVADLVSEDDLRRKLTRSIETGQPLRVKLGADPTRPDLHLGHAVILRKMRQFQDLGHKVIMLIGDFTAIIGDPTGKSKTRPPVTLEQTRANAQSYLDQCKLILRSEPEVLELRYNSEWLEPMGYADVIRLASRYTVARIMERDDFKKRFESGTPISMHELLYPLTQGYDSVALKADVELGGTDQLFNNLVGRALQRDYDQEPQVVMTLPLLVGLDGVEKMSKSLDNYIGLTDKPEKMFEKIMKIPDSQLKNYYTLFTDFSEDEIQAILSLHHSISHRILAKLIVLWISNSGELNLNKDTLKYIDSEGYSLAFEKNRTVPNEFYNLRNIIVSYKETYSDLLSLKKTANEIGLDISKIPNIDSLDFISNNFIAKADEILPSLNELIDSYELNRSRMSPAQAQEFIEQLDIGMVENAEGMSGALIYLINLHINSNLERVRNIKQNKRMAAYEERFQSVAKGGIPDNIPSVPIPSFELAEDGSVTLARLMVMAGLEASLGAARRTIQGKGLKVDGQPFLEPLGAVIIPDEGVVIQKGKDKFARMMLQS